jgi:hypothetical protein
MFDVGHINSQHWHHFNEELFRGSMPKLMSEACRTTSRLKAYG